jgi:hypothetical protein
MVIAYRNNQMLLDLFIILMRTNIIIMSKTHYEKKSFHMLFLLKNLLILLQALVKIELLRFPL